MPWLDPVVRYDARSKSPPHAGHESQSNMILDTLQKGNFMISRYNMVLVVKPHSKASSNLEKIVEVEGGQLSVASPITPKKGYVSWSGDDLNFSKYLK